MIPNLSTEVSAALLICAAIPVVAWLRARNRNNLLLEELRALRQSAAKQNASNPILEAELDRLRQDQARSVEEMSTRLSEFDSVKARLLTAESDLASKSEALCAMQAKIHDYEQTLESDLASKSEALRAMQAKVHEYERTLDSLRSEARKGEDLRKYLHEQLVAAAVRQNEERRNRESLAQQLDSRARPIELKLLQTTNELERLQANFAREIAVRDAALSEAKKEISKLLEKVSSEEELQKMKLWLETHGEEVELVASGLYSVSLDPSTPDELKRELNSIKKELAAMIRDKTAAVCDIQWTINGSLAAGARQTKNYRRLMLRTFNADADSCLALVRWNNIDQCVARLKASFDYVNDMGATHATRLQQPYFDARVRQLHVMHRYKDAVYRQKEAMRARRLAEAEEIRANREIERARSEAELEEKRYAKALARAREEAGFLLGEEREKMLRIVADLEAKLSAASALKQRAISMAQITKAGFVYVVSNIGSFGGDVLKIGMTRRIDPQDRIRELGGASVPFHFDVHAMIYSENAPALENSFHRRFARHRINLANGRKEFFRVGLEEVVRFAQELSLAAEFSTTPEARDFHLSSAMRGQLLGSLSDDELNARLDAMLSSSDKEFAPGSDEEALEEA